MIDHQDTICAIATAPGGAIGILRMSGPHTFDIADKIFRPVGSSPTLSQRSPYTIAFGHIVDSTGEVIDEVLASIFRAPHSYTGEDSIEISCHGSAYILQRVLQLLIDAGARMAAPGEFTQRAYLNEKMDLTQAEAVADLIASTNKATHHLAMSQLRGHFSDELALLRDQLLKMTSLLELELDFSDHEELEFADRTELLDLATTIDNKVLRLTHSFETGNAIKQGIPVAIIGRTNVGKSTLLNRLLHEEKAIVSNIHGTTRDVIEDTVNISGVTFRFIDTAGLRQTDDVVENIGIERTYKKLSEAAIILWLTDRDDYYTDEQDMITKYSADKKIIIVRNKCDEASSSPTPKSQIASALNGLISTDTPNISMVRISAKTGDNVPTLEKEIVKAAAIPELTENDVIVTSTRHYHALLTAHDSLTRVISALSANLSGDLVAEDLRIVLDHLSDITGNGRITPQETLNNIFKHFCIGK